MQSPPRSPSPRGNALLLVVGILALTVLFGAGAYYFARREPRTSPSPVPSATTLPLQRSPHTPALSSTPPLFTGTQLAGTRSVLLDFTLPDFEQALQSGKLVVLYFYANWCPICREEFPTMQAAFDELTSDQVIGFRVNFNDNETDDAERALAQEHGIAYQHTKVFLKNGKRVLKSPETWEKSRYLNEIQNAQSR